MILQIIKINDMDKYGIDRLSHNLPEEFASVVDDVIDYSTGIYFHIDQMQDGDYQEQIRCRKCKGDRFNVGVSNYRVSVKCVECEWEILISELWS